MRSSIWTVFPCCSGRLMTGEKIAWTRYIRPLAPIPTGIRPRFSPIQPCAAMLFDVYGTLLISRAGAIGSLQRDPATLADLQAVLQRHGVGRSPQALLNALDHAIGDAHHKRRKEGIAYPEIDILRLWQPLLGWDDLERLKAFAMEVELTVNPVYPMPGLVPLLDVCRQRKIRQGIVSNAQFYTELLLEWFLGGPLAHRGFDPRLLLFSYREGRAKPSPMLFLKARTALAAQGIPAASVLFVGNDMRNDIRPAAAVGFKTALFAGDERSLRLRNDDASCGRPCPDLIVTELGQLIDAIEPPRGDQ